MAVRPRSIPPRPWGKPWETAPSAIQQNREYRKLYLINYLLLSAPLSAAGSNLGLFSISVYFTYAENQRMFSRSAARGNPPFRSDVGTRIPIDLSRIGYRLRPFATSYFSPSGPGCFHSGAISQLPLTFPSSWPETAFCRSPPIFCASWPGFDGHCDSVFGCGSTHPPSGQVGHPIHPKALLRCSVFFPASSLCKLFCILRVPS